MCHVSVVTAPPMFSLGSRDPGAAWSVGQQSVSTSSAQNKQMCGLELHGYTPCRGGTGTATQLHTGAGAGGSQHIRDIFAATPHLEGDAWLAAVGWRW